MEGRALVARNLRRLRVEKGMSQERLAMEAGVDRAFTGLRERARENPTVDTLEKRANSLGAPLAELCVEPAPGEPEPMNLKRGRRARL